MSAKQQLAQWLESVWYGKRPVARTLLMPLSALFCYMAQRRRHRLSRAALQSPVPVVVVGNISVGGTGKTPLVIWLVEALRQAGFTPGVVSRGTGGHSAGLVQADSAPAAVGDEPVLIVQRTAVPLVVGRQRPEAIQTLLQHYPACNVVIADDGLQHYRMARDLEIAVVDGLRRFGNGLCLPAGPLRERPERLAECDFVIGHGVAQGGEYAMQMVGVTLVNLADATPRPLADFAGQTVQVVTAIGNPRRFCTRLERAGLRVLLKAYPDHHLFTPAEIPPDRSIPVLMTEKDAVKCRHFPPAQLAHVWYLPVSAQLDAGFLPALLARLQALPARASTG